MPDLTEALAYARQNTYLAAKVGGKRNALAVIDAAARWADLEALIADGGRVVVEKDCNQVDCKCERRIVLGEGAEQ